MRLLAVELTRFRSRRAVALLMLAAVAAAALFAIGAAWETRPLTASDRSDAAAQAALEGERPELQQLVEACREAPVDYLGPDGTAADCETALVPSAESYFPRGDLDLATLLRSEAIGVAILVVGLMVIAGSTFIGADWATGSLSTQLLFEPRRTRVWVAKAAAVTLGSGVITLLAVGAYWLTLGAIAQARGLDVPGALTVEVGWHVVRAVALGMGAALGAYALTGIFRHTVATLALLFVYAVGGEILVNLLPVEGAGRWSVGNNARGWLAGTHEYLDASVNCAPGRRCGEMQALTYLDAGAYLGALLLVSVLVSVVWFRRREA